MPDRSPSSSSYTQTNQQHHSQLPNGPNHSNEQEHNQTVIHHPLALSPSTPPSTVRKARRAVRRSAFFNRLPPEIRDAVYAHLFDFSSPSWAAVRLVYGFYEDRTRTGWEGWGAEVGQFFGGKGEESKKGWRFEGCVCTQYAGCGWWKERTCVRGREAAVLKGGKKLVVSSKRNGRFACRIGIMGWMLSCRMAYTDSLHPLYARNDFTLVNLTPSSLISLLPSSLIPPSHLSLITSIAIPFLAFPARTEYTLLANTLLTCFPNLRRLRIGVFHPFPGAFEDDHERFLKLMRTIVRRLGQQLVYSELVVPWPSRDVFFWVKGEEYVVTGTPAVGTEQAE